MLMRLLMITIIPELVCIVLRTLDAIAALQNWQQFDVALSFRVDHG
jgi:hypothetical protein